MGAATMLRRKMPCRLTLKKSVITLCVLYILGMVLFYSGIQTTPAKRVKDSDVNPKFPDNRNDKAPRESVEERQKREKEHLPLHIRRKYDELVPKYPAMREKDPNKPGVALDNHNEIMHTHGKCVGPNKGQEFNFVEVVSKKLFVYSAFWDTRPNDFDNTHNGSYIRMMAVVRTGRRHPDMKCTFHGGNIDVRESGVTYYEMCENHGRPFGGFILSCLVPPEIPGQPCVVILSHTDSNEEHTIKVETLHPREDMNQFSVCVPPLFGELKTSKLVEFVEMSKILGAERIRFYDYQISEESVKVLEYYQEQGIVDVIPWLYPELLDRGSWYHGQSIAIQDCLYRSMSNSRFVSFNDVDEFIVPHQHDNWHQLFEDKFHVGQCALKFSAAFYTPPSDDSPQLLLGSTHRSKYFSTVRTKCISRAALVFEEGIHHVSKPIFASLSADHVTEDVAFLHHYRSCLPDYGMNCKESITDDFMNKYVPALKKNIQNVYDKMASHK